QSVRAGQMLLSVNGEGASGLGLREMEYQSTQAEQALKSASGKLRGGQEDLRQVFKPSEGRCYNPAKLAR
ncbi:MAG: hypothetical protein ABDH29_05080, partial [Aquificaceae bacterium]